MIKGSVTLITGGASGLGKITAEYLVKLGGFVTICDLPTSNGVDVAKQLGEDKCIFVPADVTSEKDVQHLITLIKEKYGRLDNVVNCAGIFRTELTYNSKTNKPHDLELYSDVLNVNTVGTFNVIRLAVDLIRKNKPNADEQRGVIINTTSVIGFEGQIGMVAYSASKAAVTGMTLPLARELASFGIRVCAISPGLFDTPMCDTRYGTEPFLPILKNMVFPHGYSNPIAYAQLVQSIIENPVLNGEVIRLDAGLRLPRGEEIYSVLH